VPLLASTISDSGRGEGGSQVDQSTSDPVLGHFSTEVISHEVLHPAAFRVGGALLDRKLPM
jgi:hypothetical protein